MTPPTKNGHAPRDPLNQERAINLSILAMSHPGKFSRVLLKMSSRHGLWLRRRRLMSSIPLRFVRDE